MLRLQELGVDSSDQTIQLQGKTWTIDKVIIELQKEYHEQSVSAASLAVFGFVMEARPSHRNHLSLELSSEQTPTPQENQPAQQEPKPEQREQQDYDIPLSLPDNGQDHIYATYTQAGKQKYFGYQLGSGTFSIDSGFRAKAVVGEYYPRIYLRVNRVDVIEHTDNNYKKHTKRALDKINMPLKGVTEQFKKGIGDNYHDVRSLFMYMGAKLSEVEDPIVAEYLYRYIDRLYGIVQDKEFIQAIEDNLCKQTLVVSGIKQERLTGTFKNLKAGSYGGTYQQGFEGVYNPFTGKRDHKVDAIFVVVKQEQGRYTAYNIKDIKLIVDIAQFSETHIKGDEGLVVPLDKRLVKEFSPQKRERLLYKCLHVHILLVNERKQKWWETNLFKAVVFAVGVAISVAFPPAGAGMTAVMQAIAVASLKSLIVSVVVSDVVKGLVFAGVIDANTGMVLVIAAGIIAGGYSGGSFSVANLATAPNLMKAVNTSFDLYNKVLDADTQLVKQKQLEFVHKDKERYKALKDTQQLLDTGVFTPSQELLKDFTPTVDLFDSPQMFYSRHNNYDVVGISLASVNQFVQMAKQIRPKPTPTTDDIYTPLYL